MPNSILGNASIIVFGLVVLSSLGLAIAAAAPPFGGGGEWRALGNLILGVCLALADFILSLVGFCLGLAGLTRPQRKKTTALAGAILNGVALLSVAVWLFLKNQ